MAPEFSPLMVISSGDSPATNSFLWWLKSFLQILCSNSDLS